jgi:ABC-2 type transport system ATP-binding protein
MNEATQPLVETFGLVRDFGRTRAPCSLSPSVAAGKVREFLDANDACRPAALSILSGLTRSMAETVRMFESDRWADPVGTRRDVAVLRLTVVRGRAGSRHGPVR